MDKATSLLSLAAIGGLALAVPTASAATLIHHWAFDGDASDSAGSANGTLEGGAVFTTLSGGQFGEAISLDGVDSAVRTGASVVPATDYTLSAWVFWENGNGRRGTIAGGQNSGGEGEVFTMSRSTGGSTDRKLFLNLLANGGQGGSIAESPDNTISTNVWQHVAYSVSSTAGTTLYLNGSVVGTNPTRTTHNPSTLNNFSIGARADSTTSNPGWFDGLIDDVAVFDGVLTTTELENARDFGAVNFAIPEPSTSLLLGLTGLALLRRRR